jgi:hypothetical protein
MPNRRHAILLFLCVFVSAFALFTRHNDFPFYYHPDEKGKADQIIKSKRNFNHPMMMLSTVEVARTITLWGPPRKDMQRVTQVGRSATAAIAALTAASLALLAFTTFGKIAGWAVGMLCVTNPLLFELAHYFKEDPWLSAGVAFVCLALNLYAAQPDRQRLQLLAAACATAAAGKYVGFALLPAGLWLVWKTSAERKAAIKRFLLVFLGVWLLFNLPFLRSPWVLFESIQEETTKLAGLTDGVSRSVPHGFYIMTQTLYGGWTLPALCLIWLAFAIRTPRKITVAEWVLAIVAVSQFVLFSFVPKSAFRYHLPVSLAFAFLAVASLARLIACFEKATFRRASAAFSVLAFSAAVYFQITAFATFDHSFRSDDRRELIAWIRTNLPPSAVIAADVQTNLPDLRRPEHKGLPPLTQRIFGDKKEAADLGTIEQLRKEGVTHLAICERTFGRYLDETRTTKTGTNQTPERLFYHTALTRGKILWSSPLGRVTYLQPGLRLIDISAL